MLGKLREKKGEIRRLPSNTRELYKQLYQEPKVFNTKDYVKEDVDVAHKFTMARNELQVYSYLCRQQEVREWLEQVLEEKFPDNPTPLPTDPEIFQRTYKSDLFPVLRTGMKLCRVINMIEKDAVKIKESTGKPFLMLENINFFLDFCKNKLKMPDYRLFLPLDLLERKNMPRVIYCLHQFATLVFEKYGIGLKIEEKTGQFQFSQEEIEKAQRDLEEYEVQISSTAPPTDSSDELEKARLRALEEQLRLHNEQQVRNARKVIMFNQIIPSDIVVVGSSKAEGVTGNADDNYALATQVLFQDGTTKTFLVPFSTGSHEWETMGIPVSCEGKPIKSATVYPVFQEHGGKVWFENFDAFETTAPPRLVQFVQNPSFEMADPNSDKVASHWRKEGSGYNRTNESHCLDGNFSISMGPNGNAVNHVSVFQGEAVPLYFDLWSKAEGVTGENPDNGYGANFHVIFTDGSTQEHFVQFTPGTHDWERKLAVFDPKGKPVKEIDISLRFKDHDGVAYFDHVTVCQDEFKQYVQNPSFEVRDPQNAKLAEHWKAEGRGYRNNYIEFVKYGHTSIELVNPDNSSFSAAHQLVVVNQKKAKKVVLSGFSKAENVSTANVNEGYGVLATITYQNGTTEKEFIAFSQGTHDWEEKEIVFEPAHPIKEISLSLQLKELSGHAYFDNINVFEEYEFTENDLFLVQALLKEGASSSKEDSEWLDEMTELKRRMLVELRKNHQLEKVLSGIEHKIALLIKNRIDVQEVLQARKRFFKFLSITKEKKDQASTSSTISYIRKNVANYQHLFYLLQTEPKYLAKIVYLISLAQMESFLETVILTLFGDVYSPREEYLLLQLLREATENEIKTFKDIAGFLEANTVIAKMIVTYNRREQGQEYLIKTLAPVLQRFIQIKDLDLEISPQKIQHQIIAEHEMQKGTKAEMERASSDQEALRNPEVKRILEERLDTLQQICGWFLEAILSTMKNLPYGLRWICKQIVEISTKQFSKQTKDEIQKTISYFVYYRFLNPAIVSPDLYNVIRLNLNNYQRKNLVQVAKVLQSLFNFAHGTPLDSWIDSQKDRVSKYLTDLVQIPDAADFLMVDKYVELTQGTKPIILMTFSEIFSTHELIVQNLNTLAKSQDDPLRTLVKELGTLPEYDLVDDDLNREVQLILTNRFSVEQEEKTLQHEEETSISDKTRDGFMELLVLLPLNSATSNLDDILEYGKQYGSQNPRVKQLTGELTTNLETLSAQQPRKEVITNILQAIQTKVDNQASARIQRRNIIKRLRLGLENLLKTQHFMNEQVESFNVYLKAAMDRQRVGTKRDKSKIKPLKISYSKLAKQGIVVDSNVPEKSQKHTTFTISFDPTLPNEFVVKAKIAGITADTATLYLDQLLEKQSQGVETLELENITININLTIHMFNKAFLQNS